MTERSPAPAPLEGIRVIDLSQNLAGPYATQILGDLGADVIKVEPPAGDPARAWGPPFLGGEGPLFLAANRNKRSVVLDLREERDRESLRRLAAGADVFVQAFRAGVIERLGFDYDAVRAMNPRVVYVTVSAYGADGPLRDQPGYDPLLQAWAGLMSVTGHSQGEPARIGTSVVDMGTGLWTALSVLAALHTRRTNESAAGTHIHVSLLDTAVAWMAYHLHGYQGTGEVPAPMGSGLGMIAPYQAFPTSDGQLMIAAANDGLFSRLCRALDLQHLELDERFGSNPDRVAHREELVAVLSERTSRESTTGLASRLREAGVPCAPIRHTGEVAADPQLRESGMLRDVPGAGIPGYADVAMPIVWDGARAPLRRAPPRAGEHTEEVLRELGAD